MTAPLYLLDTSVLIALVRQGPLGEYIDTTYRLRATPFRPLVCAVTHGEAWTVAERLNWGAEKRQYLQEALDDVVTVDIHDKAVFENYVMVWRALREAPKGSRTNIGENDIWIAAVARTTNATLLTTDPDFDTLHPSVVTRVYISPNTVASGV